MRLVFSQQILKLTPKCCDARAVRHRNRYSRHSEPWTDNERVAYFLNNQMPEDSVKLAADKLVCANDALSRAESNLDQFKEENGFKSSYQDFADRMANSVEYSVARRKAIAADLDES